MGIELEAIFCYLFSLFIFLCYISFNASEPTQRSACIVLVSSNYPAGVYCSTSDLSAELQLGGTIPSRILVSTSSALLMRGSGEGG